MTRCAARALNNKKNIMLTVRSIAENIAESIAYTYIEVNSGVFKGRALGNAPSRRTLNVLMKNLHAHRGAGSGGSRGMCPNFD